LKEWVAAREIGPLVVETKTGFASRQFFCAEGGICDMTTDPTWPPVAERDDFIYFPGWPYG
jgi:hypothetical protein